MAAYTLAETLSGDARDFFLARDGSVAWVPDSTQLGSATGWFAGRGYRVIIMPAAQWRTQAQMHEALSAALRFPDYYGRNLSALSDCLGDIADGGSPFLAPGDTGLVLALGSFGTFAQREPRIAALLPGIFASWARYGMLFGTRLFALLQSPTAPPHVPRLTR